MLWITNLKIKLYSFTVDCKEPYEIAKFYGAMLQWGGNASG